MKIKTEIWNKTEELKTAIEWIIIYNLLGITANILSDHWISITFGITTIMLDLALIASKRKSEQEKANEEGLIMKTQEELSKKEDN